MLNDILFYGADPTGSTDTTPAVMASIAAQGYVRFPAKAPGVVNPWFRFDTTVEVNEPCIIEGPGDKRIGSDPAACDLFTNDQYLDIFHINSDNVIMRQLHCRGFPDRLSGGGKFVVVGLESIVENFRMFDVSALNHFNALHFVNGSNYWVERCTLHGKHTVVLENRANSDKGDGTLRGNEFFCDRSTNSRNVFWKSGGSPKLSGNKYLDAYDAIVIQIGGATTGGPVCENEHIEGFNRYGIYAYGDNISSLHGMNVNGGWINGGQAAMYFADNAKIDKLKIGGGVNITSGGAGPIITLGAGLTRMSVGDKLITGQGPQTGIQIKAGATGQVSSKDILDCAIPVQNFSGSVSVW